MSKKISIVILTFNNLNYTISCVESIRSYTTDVDYELIIVDNNSTDDTRAWLKTQEDIKYILNDENYGFPKGVNIGINATDGTTDILLLNNDTVLTPGWLKKLQDTLYSSDDIGAVGPVSNSVANQQDIKASYTTIDEMLDFAKDREEKFKGVLEEKHLLIGYCFLVKREVLNKVGLLDELYSPGNYEDCDISLRIIDEGYRLVLCHDTFIHHAGSATFRAFPEVYSYFGANRLKFEKKWGWNHGLVSDLKFEMINMVPKDFSGNILEVCCGGGMDLLKIKFNNPNCEVYGIEEVDGVSKLAEKILKKDVYHKIEDYPYNFDNNFFDIIILGDVLSYLDNPLAFLKNIKELLKVNGKIFLQFNNSLFIGHLVNTLNQGFLSNFNISDYEFSKRVKNLLTLKDVLYLLGQVELAPTSINAARPPIDEKGDELIEKLKDFSSLDESLNYKTSAYYMQVSKFE
ncbi:MAG: glycosyltransferase [Clostridium sp.]